MADERDEKKTDWNQFENDGDDETVLSATKDASKQGAAEADPTIRDEDDARAAHGGGVQTQGLTDKT